MTNKQHLWFLFVFIFNCTISIEKSQISSVEYYFKNPSFLYSDSSSLGQININPCEFAALKELEISEKIAQILRRHPSFDQCDRMFLMWLSIMLKNANSEEEAIHNWRNIAKKHGRSNNDLTVCQIHLLNLNDADIKNLYQQAQEYLIKSEPEITQELLVRVLKRHQWHDRHQTNQIPLRGPSVLKARKINIKVLKDCTSLIEKLHAENPHVPIFEQVKNLKIFHINDFYASKGSLIAHDIFDHFWFAWKLEEEGLFNNYQQLWACIGNPQTNDIFAREGELFASIAFDFRSFHMAPSNYCPLINVEDIKNIFYKSIQNSTFTANQKRAFELIMSCSATDSRFLKGLSYIVSGMAIEFLESNRKSGFIKILDNQYCPCGYFDFFDPEHIAFIVESVYFLFRHYDRHVKIFTNISLLVEKYLTDIATQDSVSDLVIGLDDIEALDELNANKLPPKKVEWICRNLGFEAVRYSII